ncbi:cell wall teichoic acid glycosylation protein GtcA [Leuconostoc litchii]|uniref:GtrA family protein n=1 Tax=Leuconostoc litchii TaxID=1981069 RepID=A0A6P2CNX0_9LACO|nr:GtrA family protein [Leuconostoc litchii]TYC46691.1 GtrA family protein [Leuconostoc litchii]GMA70566.1 cell wall teichoic acid glycosylation protein GtcA [Leuconostoc litchii]
MDRIKILLKQYQDAILYTIFGGLTMMVNIITFWLAFQILHINSSASYLFAWFWSIVFAYLTNRTWVFHSTAYDFMSIVHEIFQFLLARAATALLGFVIFYFGVNLLKQDAQIWNMIQNVFVIISNFVLSKWIVFKKKAR